MSRFLARSGRFLLGYLVLCLSLPALAEPVTYRVDIIAPESLTEFLRNNLDIVSWSGRGDVNEEQLRQLVNTAPDQARSLLATEGYFSPSVKARMEREGETWIAILSVEPGAATKVVAVDFRISGDIVNDPEREQRIAGAREAFTLNEGDTFTQENWEASKEGATHRLHRKKYAAARVVNSRAEIDPVAQEARLAVEIDSGPAFRFGEIHIAGLERYPESTVRNYSPIRPGDPYDEEQLLLYQQRLLITGRFASAVVWADNKIENAESTPIRVNVFESVARTFEFGIGYSTDRGPRVQTTYTDRNALDRAWRLDARAKIDRLSSEVTGALTFPRQASGWNYGLEGKYNDQDIQGEQRVDWSVTGTHSYVIEKYQSRQSLQLLTENRALPDGTEDDRIALFLAQDWTLNHLDNPLAPRSGYFAGLQIGGASEAVISTRDFGRVFAKGSYLLPLRDFGTFAFRFETGAVIADDRENIPSAYLFRTGGDTTIRGYAYESIGVDEGGAVVGGRYLMVGSIEYIQWLSQQWGAAVFYDAGDAADSRATFEAVAGYGIGARWHSPVGSLSLDLAYGADVDEYRLHFNAGFVFR